MKDLTYGILNELYGSQLTEKQHDIIRSYYDFDLSVSEIAEEYGITRQAAFDALRKGEHALTDCEKNLGFMSKMNAVKEDLIRLMTALDENNIVKAKSFAADALKKL